MENENTEMERNKSLRQRAMELLQKNPQSISALSKKEFMELTHELSVYQIELEMQNEELRRSQLEIEESRSRYSDLYDFAPVGYLTLDNNGLIVQINLTACQLFGMERTALVNKPFHLYVGKNSWDSLHQHRRKMMESQTKQSCELKLIRKNGSHFTALLESIRTADAQGHFTLCRAAITDITERKDAEYQLRQIREELERSNKELEQFAYMASHDLRESLRAVNGFMDLLDRRYKGKLDEKALEYIQFAKTGAKQMDELLTGLLEYSRIQIQSKSQMPVPAQAVFSAAIADLGASITETGAAIACDALPTVLADGRQLTQVFRNLLGNAIKFRSEQPLRIHVSAVRQDNTWQFTVADNGIGIEPQYAERIFQIFQRLHTRQKYPGTGIGLAICKRIINGYGGKIWVESKPQEGSTFYFTIPDKGDIQ
jgi:two-component system, chemotaxis family, sensor kinase Cph1